MPVYIIIVENEDGTWSDCGEGPWFNLADAQRFADNDVGAPYRIEEVA